MSPEGLAARKSGLVITLRRRDALVRQLNTAIRMWFLEQDPVSIKLLVMPAYHVLRDLGKKSGNAPDIDKYVGDNFTTVYDWLRHASSDPDDYVDFAPRSNEFLLWVCTISFEKIFDGLTVYMRAFQAAFVLWLMPENPAFREGADAFLPDGISAEEAGSLSRLEFFDKLIEMFAAQIKPIP